MMIVYFGRDEIETLKMLVLYLYECADADEDARLWTDTNWLHKKIRKAMQTYGHVVDDDMNGD